MNPRYYMFILILFPPNFPLWDTYMIISLFYKWRHTDFERFKFAWEQNKNEVELGLWTSLYSEQNFLNHYTMSHTTNVYNSTYADKGKCYFLTDFYLFLEMYF